MPLSLKRKEYQYSYSLSPGSELDEKLQQIKVSLYQKADIPETVVLKG